jgi:hypothetical protein
VFQIKQPVTDDVLRRHLAGQLPYGVYLLVNDRTRAVVADFDVPDLEPAMAFVAAARRYDLPAYIERSKSKGHHVWMFFEGAGVLAAKARLVAHHVLDELGHGRTEVFPKHDRLDSRTVFGSFIFAPLFGASVSRGRTVFVRPDDPTKPSPDQWAFLDRVQRVPESRLDTIIELNDLGTSPRLIATPAANRATGAFSPFGLPPCAQRMLQEGVHDYQRVSCFRLAVQLKRLGLPADVAQAALAAWASKNRPAVGRHIIMPDEIAGQLTSAYSGSYRGCGCEDPAVQPYCSPDCPIHAQRSGGTGPDGPAAATNRPSAVRQTLARRQGPIPTEERSPSMTQRTSQRPVKEFRAGPVKVAIWQNEAEQDGRPVIRHSIRIGKRYFDRQQNAWQDSDYFFVNDLPRLRLLVEKAFEFIALKESDPDSSDASGVSGAESQ